MLRALIIVALCAMTCVVAGELKIDILTEGSGITVPNKSQVKCHYVLKLENGTKVDSSRDRNQPFEFQVGLGMVIKGWEEGILKMKKGEKSMLTIPPELGYGERGAGGAIPPNSTLKFEVEIIDFTPPEDDL